MFDVSWQESEVSDQEKCRNEMKPKVKRNQHGDEIVIAACACFPFYDPVLVYRHMFVPVA